jgi:transcriptional regulator with XRE-family HTH domain
MARAALGWSLDKLAEASGVNRKTILRFERGEAATRTNSLDAIRHAFESAGIQFGNGGKVLPPI